MTANRGYGLSEDEGTETKPFHGSFNKVSAG